MSEHHIAIKPDDIEGVEIAVEGYDDRYLRLWPLEEAPSWATEALGMSAASWAQVGAQLHSILFVPVALIKPSTPDDWWALLLAPAGFECAVKSVDEDGACVLGLVRTL